MTESISASTMCCYMAVPTCLQEGMPNVYRSSMLVWPNLLWQTSQDERIEGGIHNFSPLVHVLAFSHARVSRKTYQNCCYCLRVLMG